MSEGKRIAIVSNTSWSVYNFRLGLLHHLRNRGFDVHVIAPRDRFSARLVAEGFSYHSWYLDNYSTNPFKDLRSYFHLLRLYRRYRFDLAIHYTIKPNIYGSLAAYRRSIPSIAVTTGLGHMMDYDKSLIRWLSGYLYKLAARVSHRVVFLNQPDLEEFVGKGIVKREKTFLLHSEGIDTEAFPCLEHGPKGEDGKTVFLFAGRLIWDKGLEAFSACARRITAKHPDIEFHLLGFIDPSNPNSVSFETIEAWQNEGILRYLGETEDVRPYLRAASCVIFPSYYREGISRILLEAASMCIPIITSDHVGCRDVVDDGVNGFLVDPHDTEAVIAAVERFLGLSPEVRMEMGRAGRQKAKQEYAQENVFTAYDALIDGALNT